jgi:hypothetical protein
MAIAALILSVGLITGASLAVAQGGPSWAYPVVDKEQPISTPSRLTSLL